MSILPSLIPTANDLLLALGGYEQAASLYSDQELTEMCLFYGDTFTITPFVQRLSDATGQAGGEDVLVPVPFIPLESLGWRHPSPYRVLDRDFNLLYRVYPKPLSAGDAFGKLPSTQSLGVTREVYCWGLSPNDRALTMQATHGGVFYLEFQTDQGPRLAQMIVSQETLGQDDAALLQSWRQSAERQLMRTQALQVNLLNHLGVRVRVGVARGLGIPDEVRVMYSNGSEFLTVPPEQKGINLRLQGNGHFGIRAYQPVSLGLGLVGLRREQALGQLSGQGYRSVLQNIAQQELWYNGNFQILVQLNGQVIVSTQESRIHNIEIDIAGQQALGLRKVTQDSKVFYRWRENTQDVTGTLRQPSNMPLGLWTEDWSRSENYLFLEIGN
jgi:hypothetical protein